MRTVHKEFQGFVLLGSTLLVFLLMAGCNGSDTNSSSLASTSDSAAQDSHGPKIDLRDVYQSDKTVCNPFNEGQSTQIKNGLVGKLYYLPKEIQRGDVQSPPMQYDRPRNYPPSDPWSYYTAAEMPRYHYTSDYFIHGIPIEATVFFSQVNVPTRAFELGFVNKDNQTLQDEDGNKLIEFFALKFRSEIRLTAADKVGKYQFALLSDDGSVLWIKDGNSDFRMLINNDGLHPTQLGCAFEPVSFDRSTSLPILIDYYQGPRFHISNILLWREWSDKAGFNPNDRECDNYSNTYFFDSTTQPSKEKAGFLGLLQRGWKVVPAENFFIPAEDYGNPCDCEGEGCVIDPGLGV